MSEHGLAHVRPIWTHLSVSRGLALEVIHHPALPTPAACGKITILPSFLLCSAHQALPYTLSLGPHCSPGDVGPSSIIFNRWEPKALVGTVGSAQPLTGQVTQSSLLLTLALSFPTGKIGSSA